MNGVSPEAKICLACRVILPGVARYCLNCGIYVGGNAPGKVDLSGELFAEENPDLAPRYQV